MMVAEPTAAAWTGRPDIQGVLFGLVFGSPDPAEDRPEETPAATGPEYYYDFAPAESCYCHIDPPCSYCTEQTEEP
jgi:hypothetical protein